MKARKETVGIVGAGPSGIVAALEARKRGAEVFLFDSNPRAGRKLLATGAGRCNLSNAGATAERYYCDDIDGLRKALSIFGPRQLAKYFEELGIFTFSTPDGWYYPLTESASNVVDILEAHLRASKVCLCMGVKICDLSVGESDFCLSEANVRRVYHVNRVIIATGGKASPASGSDGQMFTVLEKLGHQVLPVLPALAPVLTEVRPIKGLRGVRLDAGVSLFANNKLLQSTFGNIIFTEWGVNGPGVMDLSYLVGLYSHCYREIEINFLGEREQLLRKLLEDTRFKRLPAAVVFESVLPVRLVRLFMERVGVAGDVLLQDVSRVTIEALLQHLRHFRVAVRGTRSFDHSQLSIGGIPLQQVNPLNMESRLIRGLHFAGEVLNVAGPCGGYNLQWAFTSGYLAGRGIEG